MDITLKDGTRVVLRAIRPQDKGRLADSMDRLSDEARRMRFLAPKSHLTERELRYLTEVDDHDHVAVVAVAAEDPDRIVGVGRFVRLGDDPSTAEFAIVVGDAFQGLGLGTALATELARRAVERGIRVFTATTLSENVAVQRLIATISTHLEYRGGRDGVVELVADLADRSDRAA